MEEKRQDLKIEKQKRLLLRMVNDMSREDPGFYYLSTGEVAHKLKEAARDDPRMHVEEKALIDELEPYDIQILLSLH